MNDHHKAGYAVLLGRPNVGKSSLLNRLLGQKLAITSHKPQTTRHRILGISSLPQGQIIYLDTPGVHQRGGKALNRYLNRTARTALEDVDLIVFVTEAASWTEEDEMVLQWIRSSARPVLLVINKIDTIKRRQELLPLLAEAAERTGIDDVIPVSASNGDNCDKLQGKILEMLPEGDRVYPEDQISDRPERFFASELIREQITRRYHKELPYAVSIEIEQFEEQPNIYKIGAIIWVERENQKGILVGKGGQALKETATGARKELESFFQQKVYLRLWVKVKDCWSSDQSSLAKLGYGD